MFGKNKLIKQYLDPEGDLKIVDIFHTIQGEGPFAGTPAVFVRTAGCNLKCHFCDTDFESNERSVTVKALTDAVMALAGEKTPLVVITGGEPLLQNIVPFCKSMVMNGMRVQIETAGTVWVPYLERVDVEIVCSPKTHKIHQQIAVCCENYKYIYGEGDTFDTWFVSETQNVGQKIRLFRPSKFDVVWVQPRDDQDPIKNRRNTELARDLCLEHGFKLCLQIHKIVDLP